MIKRFSLDHLPIAITALVLLLVSCTAISGLRSKIIQFGHTDFYRPDQTELAATATAPETEARLESLSWPEDEPLPASLEDIHRVGVDQGFFSEGEGLLLMFEALFAVPGTPQIPGADHLPFVEVSWLRERALAFIEANPESQTSIDLRNHIEALAPSEDALRRYASPLEAEVNRVPGLAVPEAIPGRQLNCRSLWLQGFPGPSGTDTNLDCFRSIAIEHDGQTFEVFLPSQWSSDRQRIAEAQAIAEAMVRSYDVYQQHGVMKSASAIFVPWAATFSDTAKAAIHRHLAEDWESCPLIFFLPASGVGNEALKWYTAHEMFHCFQGWNYLALQETSGNDDWWVEGSAVYFSNVVYPDFQGKHDYLPRFDIGSNFRTTFEMSYHNYVLFQHLANTHGNEWIIEMLGQMPTKAPIINHQQALSSHVSQDEYHEFGQAYLDEDIPDTGGGSMPISTEYLSTLTIEQEGTRDLLARPFLLRRHLVHYAPNKHFVQSPQPSSEGRITYRLDITREWSSVPADVRSFCSDPDGVLLLTTTQPGQSYTVQFEIPEVNAEVWEMSTSTGQTFSGDRGIYTGSTASPLIHLSQSDSTDSEPLINLTSGGIYVFETADGTEYSAQGERTLTEMPSGSLKGEFSARFWADPFGPLRGDPPDFSGSGSFEACPQE